MRVRCVRGPRSGGEPRPGPIGLPPPRSALGPAPPDKRPRLPRLHASSPFPALVTKHARATPATPESLSIRILVQIFVQTLDSGKLWRRAASWGGSRRRQSAVGSRSDRGRRSDAVDKASGRNKAQASSADSDCLGRLPTPTTSSPEASGHDVAHIRRQRRLGGDSPQHRLGMTSADLFERAP